METCDRCGPTVAAQVFLKKRASKLELALCAHHYSDNALILLAGNWTITEDNREKLTT